MSSEDFLWPDDWASAIPNLTRVAINAALRWGLSAADREDAVQLVLQRIAVEAALRKRHFPSVPELCGWAKCYLWSQLCKQRKKLELRSIAPGVDIATLPDESEEDSGHEPFAVYLSLVDDPREREILSLRYVDGLKLREAAEQLGVSISSVQKLHARALEKLRRRLSV